MLIPAELALPPLVAHRAEVLPALFWMLATLLNLLLVKLNPLQRAALVEVHCPD